LLQNLLLAFAILIKDSKNIGALKEKIIQYNFTKRCMTGHSPSGNTSTISEELICCMRCVRVRSQARCQLTRAAGLAPAIAGSSGGWQGFACPCPEDEVLN